MTQQHEAEGVEGVILYAPLHHTACKELFVSEGLAPTDFLIMEGKYSVVVIPKPSTGYEPEPVRCI